jgi:hypothetical protein
MIITINGRNLEIGIGRTVNNTILEDRMAHNHPPIGSIIPIASNAQIVITSATTVRAENIDDSGKVTAARDNTITSEQMSKLRDQWAINEASC